MARPKTFSQEEAKARQRESLKRFQARNREKLRLKAAAKRAADPERARALAHANYLATKEKKKARRAELHVKNPEKRRASHAQWVEKNPSKMRSYWAKYSKTHPHKMREKSHRRRAKELGATIGDPAVIFRWEQRWRSRPKVRCYWCSERFIPKECHADHIVPLTKGGAHSIENLCISCQPCNSKKHAKTLDAWNDRIAEPVLL